jgi:hypothetical protein
MPAVPAHVLPKPEQAEGHALSALWQTRSMHRCELTTLPFLQSQ